MSSKIRILHVIYALSGGGAERQLKLLIKYAPAESSHAIFCVNPDDVDTKEWRAKFFVHRRRRMIDLELFRTCRNCILRYSPDVIHVWLPPVITIPAMLMSSMQGRPVIFSYRNLMRFRRFLDVVEYCVALFCSTRVVSNNLICQSSFAYRLLYYLKKGCTIPNGFDFTILNRQLRIIRKSSLFFRFIFVGRLVEQKNILYLIQALSLLPNKYTWQLNVYGEGIQKPDAIKLATELGIIQHIVFHGFESDIYPKIAESDLLIMPSIAEGMPNVLIEALSMNVPVVASSIPSILDVVGDSQVAILVDPNDPRDIADGIQMYMDNQDMYINKAKQGFFVVKKHDACTMSIKYHNEYKKIVYNFSKINSNDKI